MAKLRLDIPTYDAAEHYFIQSVVEGIVATDDLLKSIPVHKTIHGGPTRLVTQQTIVDQPMSKVSSNFVFDLEVMRNSDIEKYIEILYDFGESAKAVRGKFIFEQFNKASDELGNTVDAQGEILTFDHIIKLYEKVGIDFDEDGKPNLPKLVMNPETMKKFENIVPTPEQAQRYNEMIERKRSEHFAKKRNRRLS
jgi:hypothetical protein